MKILMFAGPGCIGKTTQLEGLVAAATDAGKKVAFHKSSTRKSYERAGLTKESDALKDPEFNQTFQDTVYNDNLTDLLNALEKAKEEGADLFVADRSPFDYVAYYFTVFQQYLTIDKVEEKRKLIHSAMVSIHAIDNDIQIVPFIYPVSWSKDTNSSDGWRADKTGKNFIWGSIVSNELAHFEKKLSPIPLALEKEKVTDFLFNHCFPAIPTPE